MLEKYRNIYKNYLKEYKKAMYNNFKNKGILEEQIIQDNSPPKTNEFIVIAKYNQMINNLVNKLILKEIPL